jgi:iron complex outermembrane receptor protein
VGHEAKGAIVLSRFSVMPSTLVACAVMLPTPVSFAASDDETSREEVIVTAEKFRAQSLKEQNSTASRLGISALDTPAAVQVVSGDAIRLRGDADIGTAVTRSVGLTSSTTPGGSGYGVTARGFGSSSVTALYDGLKSLINIGSQSYPFDTWNIERIEVLNGPASVLHGNGAIGGAINIITRKPSRTPESSVMVSGGSFDRYRAALDTTGGITEELSYRLDVSRFATDGYVARGGSEGTAVTGSLAYEAAGNLKFTLSGDYADREQTNDNGLPLIDGRLDRSLRSVNYSSNDATIPFEDQRLHLLAEWSPAQNVEVRNATYYIHGQRLWKYPARFVHRPATNDVLRGNFSTFLQYQNQVGDHAELTWKQSLAGFENAVSFGVDINQLENKRYVDTYSATDVVDLRNTSPGNFPTTGAIARNYQRTRADQYAVFAEDRLALSSKLAVIGGLRYEQSKVEREDLVTGTSVRKTFEPLSWRMGAVYELASQLNVYAQYATATDSVGNLCCVSAAQLAFALNQGRQSEVGVKGIVWDDRVEWSLAGYRIVKNRLLTPDPFNPGQSLQVGQQSSRGLEASIAMQLPRGWRIELNGATLEARYDDFSENVNGVPVSRDGKRPINVPQQSANLWVTWTISPHWQAQAGARYVGSMYTTNDNTQVLPSYTVVDAGVHWDPVTQFGVDVRLSNALDKFYAHTSSNNGGQWILGAPRAVEIAVTTRF